jgi:hypothetical protein
MYRDRELAPGRRSAETSSRRGRRADNPALALQQAVGNRAFAQMLARKSSVGPTIKIGKFTIDVAGGNLAAWATGGDPPDVLEVTSEKGKHSAELARLFKESTRIKSLTLTVAAKAAKTQDVDVGSFAIELTNSRVTSYALDGKAESWAVAGFDGVHRKKTTRKIVGG